MKKQATFGAGCFWGVEETFRKAPGVLFTEVGYAGGTIPNPTYEKVCSGVTGHAEVVHLEYDPKKVTYEELLSLFFHSHDPTSYHKQGPDIGSQYRSVIFYHDDEQKKQAEKAIQNHAKEYKKPIVTEIRPFQEYYVAEKYHQKYLLRKNE